MATIDGIQLMAIREEMCDPLTGDEVLTAFKNYTASNDLLPVAHCWIL